MERLRSPVLYSILGILALALAGGALFLSVRPFSEGDLTPADDLTPLTAGQPFAEHPDGLQLSVDPSNLTADFKVKLTATPSDAFLNAPGSEWEAARAALPTALQLRSNVFKIETSGQTPRQVSLAVALPLDLTPRDHLDLYTWTGERWEFVPAHLSGQALVSDLGYVPASLAVFQTAAQVPFTTTTLEIGQEVDSTGLQALNQLSPAGLRVQADGALSGALAGGFSQGQGYAILPVIRNYGPDGVDTALLETLLRDESIRAAHAQDLVEFVLADGYDGVVIDYRGIDFNRSTTFSNFISELAVGLHAQHKRLGVVVETPSRVGEAWSTGGYDWRALGAAADFLEIPLGNNPTAYGDGSADELIAWATGEVSRHKILLATSALSVDSVAGGYAPIGFAQALEQFGQVRLLNEGEESEGVTLGQPVTTTLSGQVKTLIYDEQANADRLQYLSSGNEVHTTWLTGANVLLHRFELAERHRLGGVSVRDLFDARTIPDVAGALVMYKTNVAAQIADPPVLLWTVTDADGQVIQEASVAPNRPFEFLAQSVGEYRIAAKYRGAGSVELGTVSVEVAEAPPVITPEPVVAAQANVGGGAPQGGQGENAPPAPAPAPAPPPVVAPIATGNFELGGQVIGGIPAGLMQSAHMRWVKTQARGGDMSGFIAEAHGQGLKVQLTVLLDIARVADPGYWPEVAAYAAAQAAAGADAIEVWNEMNIDAEWPAGQINPATYVEMLKQVYAAIKAANPATLVIGGALAPTGAENAFPGRVMNDDKYLAGMAAAGAANYVDCIGIHYNTGTTGPSATEGSALGGYHYSYYFWPMINLYWDTFGGTRPLCFTELGYLSAEGYGALPANFAWASGVTVAHQSAWLAEAASLAGNSGKVRLMIIWNVNSTTWTHDPQAGYAIIRPNGTCPACSALAAVAP